jgi:mucin-19
MGLTRTRFSQANTVVAKIQDPITVLNSSSSLANVDVGFLINRNQGIKANAAVFWSESGSEFVTALTANNGIPDSNVVVSSYANLRSGSIFANIGGGNDQANVYVTGSLIPSSNVAYDLGTDGRRFRDLWLSGTTLHMGDQRLTVTNGEWRLTTPTTTVVLGTESTVGNLTVTGNLNLQGSSSTFDSNNLSVQDSIIELHTLANLAPLTGDDGRDIGLKFHYYKTQDEHAFLGWSNTNGYLEWYDSGREGVGNVFIGNTYGGIKSGTAWLANSTPSTSTTSGALRVSGGVGIAGNLYIANTGDVSANIGTIKTNLEQLDTNISLYQTYANTNAASQASSITSLTSNAATQHTAIASLDANIGTVITEISSIVSGANANTAAYLLTATGNIAVGNINVTGNVYGSIVPTAIFKSVYVGSTLVNLARGTGTLTVDDFNTTGYAAQANLATLATNATKTTVTSNISSGTAYVTFVNATTGNVDQNINTALTYNPDSGNLTAYGLVTTTGLFWANGTAFSSSSYGNTDVALYLPDYSGTINATVAQASQPNITDLGTLVNLDVSGSTYLTGFVTMDGTGGSTPQYSVTVGNADGEKLAFATRGTAGYGVGLETLKDDESGYGKLNVTASEIHFNIKNGSAATVQNNAIVVQANGMVTLDSTVVSTSSTTGALVVKGGVGIGGDLTVEGNLTVQNISYTNQEIITTTEIAQGNLVANSGVESTSNVTGALVVRGGIGATGNVYTNTVYTTTGIRWAGNGVAFSSGGAGLTYTANTLPPTTGNIVGDQWYNTSTNTLYEYLDDGTSKYWVDTQSPILFANTSTTVNVLGETTITGNLVPSANITYSLGTSTNRFKDLFLSGSTIDLGGATIKTDASSGAIALIPQPTLANPNPTGIVVSPSGTVSTVSTTGGELAANAIGNSSNTAVSSGTTTFGNIDATGNITTANLIANSNVIANKITTTTGFFWSNGTAFASSTYGNTEVASYLVANPQGSTYSNANVASYFTSNNTGMSSRTDAVTIPIGTTGQRPTVTANGMMRYNTTLNRIEAYLYSSGWVGIVSDSYTVQYLVVAGGGAGGGRHGGGGGAGGLKQGTTPSNAQGSTMAITIGAGAAAATGGAVGGNGTNTSLVGGGVSVTSTGGGGGGIYPTAVNGIAGGSGGGAGSDANGTGGTGVSGEGYPGGDHVYVSSGDQRLCGGGGGAGAAGTTGTAGTPGHGGVGVLWEDGYYYAGGGGGSKWSSSTNAGNGGSGGGGGGGSASGAGVAGSGGTGGRATGAAGVTEGSSSGGAGGVNTGGGGGGGSQTIYSYTAVGGAGGSGTVIIRYSGSQRGTGGTITASGGYTYHVFTGSGTYTF